MRKCPEEKKIRRECAIRDFACSKCRQDFACSKLWHGITKSKFTDTHKKASWQSGTGVWKVQIMQIWNKHRRRTHRSPNVHTCSVKLNKNMWNKNHQGHPLGILVRKFRTCVICVHPNIPTEKNERVVKRMAPCTALYFIRSAIFRMITPLESFCEHGDGSHFSCWINKLNTN